MGPWHTMSTVQCLSTSFGLGREWRQKLVLTWWCPATTPWNSILWLTQGQDAQSHRNLKLTIQGAGSQLSICSLGCNRPLPQRRHSLWDCKLLKAVPQSHLLPNMWNEVGYTLGSHPQDLLLPWDHPTSVKNQGWDLWLCPPLRIMASHRPGEESPVVLGCGSGDARRW